MRAKAMMVAVVCGAALSSAAWAAPTAKPTASGSVKASRNTMPMGPHVGYTDATFADNFDGYANGSLLLGQGPWVGWNVPLNAYPFPPDARVTNAQAASAPHSMALLDPNTGGSPPTNETDAVWIFSPAPTSGKWIATLKTYVSTGANGQAYFILMDQYNPAAVGTAQAHWTVQVELNADVNNVNSQWLAFNLGINTPLIRDQWVEIRADIDLDTLPDGLLVIKYGGTTITAQPTNVYNGNTSAAAGGLRQIQAVDLYRAPGVPINPPLSGIYFDDFKLTSACYPDCDGSGTLTIADFGCFQTKFVQNDPYADCDGSGTLTIADFGCFQTKFVQGCP